MPSECTRPWEAMYRALLRRFTELVEELDKVTTAHNDLYQHFLDDTKEQPEPAPVGTVVVDDAPGAA